MNSEDAKLIAALAILNQSAYDRAFSPREFGALKDVEAKLAVMVEALRAAHAPYAALTDEALEAGILMEFGPPKPQKGAALLLVRRALSEEVG